MTGIGIRLMREGDVDAVFAMAGQLPHAPHWSRGAYVLALEAEGAPPRIALVAELAGERIAGFAIASFLPPEAELETIAVAAALQGGGVGTALLRELLERLGARGVATVHLEVRASNAAALGLYAKLGFTGVGVRRGYYADPAEDAVVLRAALA